jgi:hypothetical protein
MVFTISNLIHELVHEPYHRPIVSLALDCP